MTIPPPAPDNCTDVSPLCPVEGTTYGYYPSMGANAFFAAFFGICLIVQLGQGVWRRTWSFMIALSLGCLGECLGYIGRIILHNNPFSSGGFQIQICCLIISPAFISGGLYLTLKHLVRCFGQERSRLPARLYTWIFISCDLLSLVMQGAGGGIAATAKAGSSALDTGTNLMIAGIVFQVVVLAVFGLLVVDYLLRTWAARSQLSGEAAGLAHAPLFRCFLGAIVVAYFGVLTRSIYRIPELAAGWRSETMRNEAEFIVLEGVMIVLSVLVLTVFHPGWCFPAMADTFGNQRRDKPLSHDSGNVELSGAQHGKP